MTVEQWNALSQDSKEKLLTEVFNNQYLALRASRDPNTDTLIKKVLDATSLNGDIAYINIHKKIIIH